MSEPDASVLDWVFRVLADSRRRFVLAYLIDTEDGTATFDELVDAVVEAETHSPAIDRETVAIPLDHHHLPLLDEKGLIEYERDRGVVQTTDRAGQVETYFELIPELDPFFQVE